MFGEYIMNFVKDIRRLCTPAYLYLIISSISTIALMFQNTGSSTTFCAGSFECDTPSVLGVSLSGNFCILRSGLLC